MVKKKIVVKIMAFAFALVLGLSALTACESDVTVNKKTVYGTWGIEGGIVNGSFFSVEEMKSMGESEFCDMTLVLKEGGAGYLHADGEGMLIEWSETEDGIEVESMEGTFEDGKIILNCYDTLKLVLVKTSDSQTIKFDEITSQTETTAEETKTINEQTTEKQTRERQTTTVVETAQQSSDTTGEGVEIIAEYIYERYGSTEHLIIVKNNTDKMLQIDSNSIAKDASGNTIGVSDGTLWVLGPGEESVIEEYCIDTTGVSYFETKLSSGETEYYKSAISYISVETTMLDSKVIVTCMNNGEEPVKSVEVYALFFKDGTLVDFDYEYVSDYDSELKPGNSQAVQLTTYEEFDDVKVYVDGLISDYYWY